ncbi:CPBP family intramembrane glutamic endopeptidase [Taibaiella soli]|uniref:CAAX prenyl protease 2/Lysostaphin resistance protein A-like domain-containing protein n=1 Tax=Taibaiella soli TaxID=1649169 RepID=A0A2W2AA59_9BACT|nr:CPBP family intramembrane glutamic endopeptidase [Taibaiella soli]PZF72171.1 hypothetical protein DN068_14655 [Taibaiella soli]
MLKQYLRNYPWYLQLLILIVLISAIFSLVTAGLLPIVLQKGFGVSLNEAASVNEHSSPLVVRASLWVQCISHIGIFTVPCLIFAYLAHPKPASYLGFRKAGKNIQYFWVILTMLGAVPFFVGIEQWMRFLPLGNFAKEMQEKNDQLWGAYLNFKTLGEMLVALFVFAIVPAFGEELLFRSVLMRFAHKFTVHQGVMMNWDFENNTAGKVYKKPGMFFSVAVTSLLFALIHFNIYGFVSILLAGVLLAMIYYLTGSIWCSMLAHLMNNGLQVVLLYVFRDNATWKAIVDGGSLPAFVPIVGGLVMVGGFYMLWRSRTPLPENWSADFTVAELAEKKS